MTQSKNFFDSLQKIADCALSSAVEAKDTAVEFITSNIDSMMKSRYLVSREEFEALKAVVEKIQDKLFGDSAEKCSTECQKENEKQPQDKQSSEDCSTSTHTEECPESTKQPKRKKVKKSTEKLDA